jgi:hypothetical protein
MNKRIRKLAEQAAKYSAIMALPTGQSGNELFVEKFAELIVRECALQCIHNEDMDLIEKHFGVEE